MPTFQYKAITDQGHRKKGTVTATNEKEARRQLRTRGWFVQRIEGKRSLAGSKPDKPALASIARNTTQTSSPPKRLRCQSSVTLAVREMATLLAAGVSLPDSIDAVARPAKGYFRETMMTVRDDVTRGKSLADAMSASPDVFDPMLLGMVRVGEQAGNLDEVFAQVADFRERYGQLKDKVLSALLYPIVVLAVAFGVTVFLMTVVVPMLLQNLVQMGRPLPWPTKVLQMISELLRNHGWWLLLALALILVATLAALSVDKIRRRIDQVMLKIPVLGNLIRKQSLSRMALIISSLLRSGIELVDAMRVTSSSIPNRSLSRALAQMCDDLQAGRSLRSAAEDVPLFTPAVIQVMVLGQQSGKLEDMLERLGNDYDRQVSVLATRLTTVLEPIMIVVLSVIVGFILFATILPILEAGNVLGV